MIVNIKLTTAGADTGPFNIFSNADNYVTAVATDVPKIDIAVPPSQTGYNVTIPDQATIVRVASTGTCTGFVNIPITSTYELQITAFFLTPQEACAAGTSLTQNVTYAGNLEVGTILNGLQTFSESAVFVKVVSSTQPGFTYTGYVLGFTNQGPVTNDVVSINAC